MSEFPPDPDPTSDPQVQPFDGMPSMGLPGVSPAQPAIAEAGAVPTTEATSRLALARKWRPRSFEALIGQELVVRALRHALDTGRLHHAYLLSGTRGVGKTTIARLIAKAVNCIKGPTSRPCGQCVSCVGVDAGRFPDYVEMDAASNRRVEEMTVLLENAAYAPAIGRYKVFVIDEVHMLTNHAFNAMLKTLEEPPGHVIFVLATTDPQKVPVTVLSRCLHFALRNVAPDVISAHLRQVLTAERVPNESGALALLGRAAAGSVRDALSLLDQAIALGGGEVTEGEVRAMLGTVDDGMVDELVQLLVAADGPGLVALADRCREGNVSFGPLLLEFAARLQRAALLQVVGAASDLAAGTTIEASLVRQVPATCLQVWYQVATHGARDLPLAPEPSVGFLMTAVRMLAFAPDSIAENSPGHAATDRTVARKTTPARDDASMPADAPAGAATPVSAADPDARDRGDGRSAQRSSPTLALDDAAQAASALARGGDGLDWGRLASEIKLTGMARQFMNQSELLGVDGNVLRLRVPMEQLADPVYIGRVQEAVSRHTGRAWRFEVTVGQVAGETFASRQAKDRAQRQSDADAAIAADPFVQDLMKSFDAKIIPNSIEPSDGEQQP